MTDSLLGKQRAKGGIMNGVPFVAFSNDTLDRQPRVHKGDIVECPHCGGEHILCACDDGSEILLFYNCGGDAYLGAIGGRLTIGTPADMSGRLRDD